ncbi:MAG: DUF3795 domain-containing protein [Promethearchaeota archaeon]|jgi:hypothetical protein
MGKNTKIDGQLVNPCGATCILCEEYYKNKIGAAEWLLKRTAIWVADYVEDVPNFDENSFYKDNGFKIREFLKGLFWYKNMEKGCSGCHQCEITECIKKQNVHYCMDCNQFVNCDKIRHLCYKYPFLKENYKDFKNEGITRLEKKYQSLYDSGKRLLDLKSIPWRELFNKSLKDINVDFFDNWHAFYKKGRIP